MRGVGEVTDPPEVGQVMDEGEGEDRNNLRIAMEDMDMGGKDMDKRYMEAVNKEDEETEGAGLGGGGLELEITGIITQDAEPGSTTLVDA